MPGLRPVILYIHGFTSCGWGTKSLSLRRHFGLSEVIAPDLPFAPLAAIEHLHALCRRYPVRALVGSSLGGFYATCLNARQLLPTVLINPVVRPTGLLDEFRGKQHRWCDGHSFLVDDRYLDALTRLQRAPPGEHEAYLVLLQQGDDVLDYRLAEDFYRRFQIDSRPGGSHRFDDFDAYLPLIERWLAQPCIRHAEEDHATA